MYITGQFLYELLSYGQEPSAVYYLSVSDLKSAVVLVWAK